MIIFFNEKYVKIMKLLDDYVQYQSNMLSVETLSY